MLNAWRFPLGVLVMLMASPMVHGEQSPDADSGESAAKPISFQTDIQPIFSRHCYGCHQGAKQLGSYVMTEFDRLVAGGESEQPAIVPGKPEESYLVELITPIDGHAEMPDEPFPPLSEVEIDLVRKWIESGAINDAAASGPRFDPEHPPVYAGPPPIPSIDVSPDGKLLAIAGYYEVLLMDTASGTFSSRVSRK